MMSARTPVSVVIVCYNEEAILGKSLAAVHWADEIVVVDSFSTDRTVEIARQFTPNIHLHAWQGYGRQKNLALGLASCPWVLSLDADEVVSSALARELQELLAREPSRTGYRIPRRTWYLGRFLNHAWYPDFKLRLFRKDKVHWGEEQVHESIYLDGSAGSLQHPLLHYSFPSVQDHLRTLQQYTTLGAEDLLRQGRAFTLRRLVGSPLVMFFRQYLWKRGFLDGVPGLIACSLSALHEFVKYAKLYELSRRG